MDKSGTRELRQPLKVAGKIVSSRIGDGRFHPWLKCCRPWGVVTSETDAHHAHPVSIYIWSALKIVNGIANRHLEITAHWMLEFHLSLARAIDCQHGHP